LKDSGLVQNVNLHVVVYRRAKMEWQERLKLKYIKEVSMC